ncbi:MAG: copper amine oxidase N-terminal domain-containing protein [Anaerotignaceae bacterium]
MRKRLAVILAAVCMATITPTTSMASTYNYVSTDMAVAESTELTGSSAPNLTIESNADNTSDMYFLLNLNNAEWLYEGEGEILQGLEYTVLSGTSMAIRVDAQIFGTDVNDIRIPIYAKVLDAGVATVTIDPKESQVSGGTFTFAHVSFPGMSVTVSDVDSATGKFTISFKDDYPYSMVAGRLFKLSIDNGFVFTGVDNATGSGKYAGLVDFSVDTQNQSIAYVKITGTTGMSVGQIKITDISVAATSSTDSDATSISIEPLYGEGSAITYKLDNFKSNETVKTGKEIKFDIGGNYYVVDEDMLYAIDTAPFIDNNGRAMLPLRAIANAFEISDENILWEDETKTAVITDGDGDKISVKIGEKFITTATKTVFMDTTAVIKEGRVYLPMRAVLNALNVSDDNIKWDDKEKSVTVYCEAN